MPVEVMARRGEDTLRFGPLKPRGLVDPKTGREPYAVVQLRRDNADGSIYNLVGFQTHLKWGEQKRVFSHAPSPPQLHGYSPPRGNPSLAAVTPNGGRSRCAAAAATRQESPRGRWNPRGDDAPARR